MNRMGIKGNILDSVVIRGLQIHELDYRKYLIFIVKERMGLLLFVLFFSNVRWKQIYGGLLTFMVGIAGGTVLSMAIAQAGIKGGINCILCLLPHSLFYGLVYMILVNYWMKNGTWNWSKTGGVVIFMILGILSEVFINPSLVKLFM